jgi:hypothetical protein
MDVPAELILRDQSLKGRDLRIVPELSEGPARVAITDGERTAIYSPIAPWPSPRTRRYKAALQNDPVEILPEYTEAGAYCQANCVTLTDGKDTAIFVPVEPVERFRVIEGSRQRE